MLRGLNWLLFAAGLLLVATTVAMQADAGLGVFAIPLTGFFIALACTPFIPFGILNRRATRPLTLAICTLMLIALSAFWIRGFGGVFWWNDHPDAQDGLAIIVLPTLMFAVAAPIALGAWALERYLSRHGP